MKRQMAKQAHSHMRVVIFEGLQPVLQVLLVPTDQDTTVASSQARDFEVNLILVTLLLCAFQLDGLTSRMRELLDQHIDPLIAQADGELGSFTGGLVPPFDPSKN